MPTTAPDASSYETLRHAIGHQRRRKCSLAIETAQAFAAALEGTPGIATIDSLKPDTPLPLLWHWLYFNPVIPRAKLGSDGHEAGYSFLPLATPLRRMWAAGEVQWNAPLVLGQDLDRHSEIICVQKKMGRSGEMIFVKWRHQILDQQRLLLEEWQDLVYFDADQTRVVTQPPFAPGDDAWCQPFNADTVLLFQYSALTSNSHRIHFDQEYARQCERYPGLVVHGPLIATLLITTLQHQIPDRRLTRMAFRAVSPLFVASAVARFILCGKPSSDGASLWAKSAEGALAMQATVEFQE